MCDFSTASVDAPAASLPAFDAFKLLCLPTVDRSNPDYNTLSQQVHEIQTEVNAARSSSSIADELVSLKNLLIESTKNACQQTVQETPLSPRDCAMRCVSWNLASCHATVQKLLVRQVVNKSKLWSWRVTVRDCVINMCTQPWCNRVASIVL